MGKIKVLEVHIVKSTNTKTQRKGVKFIEVYTATKTLKETYKDYKRKKRSWTNAEHI